MVLATRLMSLEITDYYFIGFESSGDLGDSPKEIAEQLVFQAQKAVVLSSLRSLNCLSKNTAERISC